MDREELKRLTKGEKRTPSRREERGMATTPGTSSRRRARWRGFGYPGTGRELS
jgi:hypothetical protein